LKTKEVKKKTPGVFFKNLKGKDIQRGAREKFFSSKLLVGGGGGGGSSKQGDEKAPGWG